MPLKCHDGEREIYSFDVKTNDAWENLREVNRKTKALKMPCCGAALVLRTSPLGTKHFAHARRGTCTTKPETAEHLLAKMFVVEGIQQTVDWTALPEQAGVTPAGEEWRADVLALKAKVKVAFEIQWTKQNLEETRRRQQRYADAGVRGLWLFRQKDFNSGKDIPAFRLAFHEKEKTFDVILPAPGYDPLCAATDTSDTNSWGQRVPLARFITGALEGRLRFAASLGKQMPVEVEGVQIPCWRCKKETRIVTGLVFAASRILIGAADIPVTIYDMGDSLPDGAAQVMAILSPALLRHHGIGEVKPRKSKTEGREYVSNGCIHCDALQGKFYVSKYINDAAKMFETEAIFKADWMPQLSEARPNTEYWWFDES